MENIVKYNKNIQAAGLTYENVVSQIKQIIKDNPDYKENWSTFYSSDAGTMLVELMAWIAENISIRQDVLYNEMFMETAKEDKNKINLLKQIGCSSDLATAATVPVELEIDTTNGLPETLNFGTVEDNIISVNGQSTDNSNVNFEFIKINSNGKPEYLSALTIDTDNNTIISKNENDEKILLVQGTTNYEKFTSETNDGPYFDLKVNNIAYNSIRIYDENNTEHKQLETFVDIELPTSKVPTYILERTNTNNIRIRYPSKKIISTNNNLNALFDETKSITVYYRTTDGKSGNISAGSLVGSTFKINNTTVTIKSNEAGSGGKNAQTLDEAIESKPLGIKTLNRAVTAEDFDYLLKNNPSVLKSKTYSAANQPESFKEFFGRNINPQEVFSFIVMNKNFEKQKNQNYNDLQFVTLNKDHVVNKEYIFNKASLNNKQNTLSFDKENNKAVLNVTPNEFSSLLNGELQNYVVAKLQKTEQKENYIKDIKNDWLSKAIFDNEENVEELNDFITLENNKLENKNVSAICTSKELTEGTPINIAKYLKNGNISICFDNLVNAEINFGCDKEDDVEYENYYILPDNEPKKEDTTVYEPNSREAANSRKGIRQIVNDQVVSTIWNEANSGNDIFRLIDGKHIYKEIPAFDDININGNYAIKIGGTKYTFTLGEETFNTAVAYFNEKEGIFYKTFDKYKYLERIEYYSYSNGSFKKVEELEIGDRVEDYYSKLELDVDGLDSIPYNSKEGILVQLSYLMLANLNNEKNLITSVNFEDNFKTLLNYKFSLITKKEKTYFVISNTTPQDSFDNEDNFIEDIDLEEGTGELSLIKTLGSSLSETIKADYTEVAKTGKINGKYKLVIKSPLTGDLSSLSITSNDSENIINEIFGINVYDSSNTEIKNTKTVKGIKSVTLVTADNDILGVKKGNFIIISNDISNNFFENIYISFKQSKDEAINILSNNDEKVVGIEGEAIYFDENEIARLDLKKSNFAVKITKDPKDTNIFYNITDDTFNELGIIENKKIRLETNNLSFKANGVKLFIGIDTENESDFFELEFDNSENVTALNIYKKALENYYKDNQELINCLFVLPDNDKKLVINNIDKSDNGSICFKCPDDADYEKVKEFYKNFLGTSETNQNFYNLYTKESMLKENSRDVIIEEGGEHYYCPAKGKILKFIYRDFVMKGNEQISKFGDYYISVNGNSFNNYEFSINKTKHSEFPDIKFYLHFINNKNKFTQNNVLITDEDNLQNYFSNKKILGTEINFLKPYVKTFDFAATIMYDASQEPNLLKKQITEELENKFSFRNLDNIKISNKVYKTDILNVIYKIINPDGTKQSTVKNVKYFGYDYENQISNQSTDELVANFNEIICLADTVVNKKGLILTMERSE